MAALALAAARSASQDRLPRCPAAVSASGEERVPLPVLQTMEVSVRDTKAARPPLAVARALLPPSVQAPLPPSARNLPVNHCSAEGALPPQRRAASVASVALHRALALLLHSAMLLAVAAAAMAAAPTA